MPVERNLGRVTPGERLWLDRQYRDETQWEACARLGVGRNRLVAWELGAVQVPPWAVPGARWLDTGAQLRLARRRSGWGYLGTARRMGVSGPTLLAWERATDRRLVTFWESRGWVFC